MKPSTPSRSSGLIAAASGLLAGALKLALAFAGLIFMLGVGLLGLTLGLLLWLWTRLGGRPPSVRWAMRWAGPGAEAGAAWRPGSGRASAPAGAAGRPPVGVGEVVDVEVREIHGPGRD